MLAAQQQLKQISGAQFSNRTGYIPAQLLSRLTARGPSDAVREVLSSWSYGEPTAPTCSVVVRLDQATGAVSGMYHFILNSFFHRLLHALFES